MSAIRIGAEGWIAKLGDEFCDENLARLIEAAGLIWADAQPGASVYVGYDTRRGARRYAELAAAVLAACGLDTRLSEVACPLPALSWAVAHDAQAVGGVMLTANNRSEDYQGVRLRQADGSAVSPDYIEQLESLIPGEAGHARGSYTACDVLGPYEQHLVSLVDGDTIRAAQLSVVVDPMYGAAAGCMTRMLQELGCTVHEIHGETTGEFHGLHPDALEPWVDACEQAVVSAGADLGLVLDGDGDRSCVVDEHGSYLPPGTLTPLVMQHLVENKEARGRAVVTLSVSAANRLMADALGIELTIVPVGFRNLYEEVCAGDVFAAIEEYGGICIPAHLNERDGLLVSLLVVELVARTKKPVSALVEGLEQEVGRLDYLRRDVRIDAGEVQAFRNVLPGLNPPELAGRTPTDVSHADGLYLRFDDDAWVLLRPSRIESLVRVYAEAPSARERDALMEAACELARGV